MRRHFSFQRLAIVVAWAALSPQCAQLVENWISLFSKATVSDAAGIVPDFVGRQNRSSDRPGTVAENPKQPVFDWLVPAALDPTPAEPATVDLQPVGGVDALRALGRFAIDSQTHSDL